MSCQPIKNHFEETLDMVLIGSDAVVGEEAGRRRE